MQYLNEKAEYKRGVPGTKMSRMLHNYLVSKWRTEVLHVAWTFLTMHFPKNAHQHTKPCGILLGQQFCIQCSFSTWSRYPM